MRMSAFQQRVVSRWELVFSCSLLGPPGLAEGTERMTGGSADSMGSLCHPRFLVLGF